MKALGHTLRALLLANAALAGAAAWVFAFSPETIERFEARAIRDHAAIELPDAGDIVRHGTVSWPLGFSGSMAGVLSGAQNVRFVARIYGCDPDELIAFVEDFSELGDFLYMPVGSYSSGMKGRLSLALLLSLDFDIYLVDEGMPTMADAEFVRKAGEVFRERLKHATLVMVSHMPRQLEAYAERAAVLQDGRLHFFDTLEDAKQMYDYTRR